MKDFIKEHPFLTFFIVLSILGTIKWIFGGAKAYKAAIDKMNSTTPDYSQEHANGGTTYQSPDYSPNGNTGIAGGVFFTNPDGTIDYSRYINGKPVPLTR